ncbi:MAG TPA: hypothetical protein VKZ91_14145 [Woeseiaceae bacterium]|nr:hypothetical protein [Woeseiaceae bacterium]
MSHLHHYRKDCEVPQDRGLGIVDVPEDLYSSVNSCNIGRYHPILPNLSKMAEVRRHARKLRCKPLVNRLPACQPLAPVHEDETHIVGEQAGELERIPLIPRGIERRPDGADRSTFDRSGEMISAKALRGSMIAMPICRMITSGHLRLCN